MERKNVVRALGLAAVGWALLGGAGLASADVVIATVPVGNAGNAADSTGYGAVGYTYNIGTYEVTAGQYTAFLNAVAATDTYSLYNANMANTSLGSGITQTGSSGSYQYTVDAAFVNRPVNYVSFWDACRFANWLSNGQGGPGTTETGTYTLTTGGISGNTITRNAGATWAVTSEDEWYKAAYFDPNKNGAGSPGYWLYPTRSDTAPGNNLADPLPGNNANIYTDGVNYPIQNPYYTTVGGQFANSASAYGTFDQGGNVWEWNESIDSGTYRDFRGGSFSFFDYNLQSAYRLSNFPTNELNNLGFRVSQVPEPASLGVLGMGVIGMLARRRRGRELVTR